MVFTDYKSIGRYFDAARIHEMSRDVHFILGQTDTLYAYLLHQPLSLRRVREHDK